jgi:RimJ/RimL family protein N-acetyltransferase
VIEAVPRTPPTLATERLLLRPLADDDAPAIAAGAGDRRVARYLVQVPTPYPVGLARRWLRSRNDWWPTGRGVTLAIVEHHDPAFLVGTASLRRYARDRRAELGYWLSAGVWGRGIATEATHALVDFGFRELGLARIYAHVLAGNVASMRVLDKLGMVHEGVWRQHMRKGRRLHDLVVYGLLRDEWR